MKRTRKDLLELADQFASEHQAPSNVIIKEILHYEILHALVESGAARGLVFQGGTALRLCYKGSRYSEDLDFAGGRDFKPERIQAFTDMLGDEIASAYGLELDVRNTSSALDGQAVSVERFRTVIRVPNANPSIPQKQVINLEIATVPSHDPRPQAVVGHYAELGGALNNLIVIAESPREILADKIVALGARSFVKHRDVWDLKFLSDNGHQVDHDLVRTKLQDYRLDPEEFVERLRRRAEELGSEATRQGFLKEMSRFVNAGMAERLSTIPAMTRGFTELASSLARAAASHLSHAPIHAPAATGERLG